MKLLPLFSGCLLLLACQAKESTSSLPREAGKYATLTAEPAAMPKQEDAATPEQPVAEPAPAVERKIIRNAQVRFRVRDFKASGRAIEAAVKAVNGLITSSQESKSDGSIETALVVRVPAAKLDGFLQNVLTESIFTDTKTITADDVTRQYVDVEARIKSKRAAEEKYLQLLKQAKSVEDVLKVEEQLDQIREEREAREAELRQLKNDVALSTVNLSYYEQTAAALQPEEPFYAKIWHNFAEGFGLLGDALVGAFFYLPLVAVLGGAVWLLLRRRRRRRATKNAA